jgi:predicted DsbA family dithiol-disulfide isomerase
VVTLHLYTDFVCPFCFIAEQSTVPRLLAEFELDLDWCGFELHPGTPPGGRPLSELFPGVDLEALHARTKDFAAGFGVTGFDPPKRLQNSRRALALAEVARAEGRLEALRHAAFEAHWRRGADLEATADLERIATGAWTRRHATITRAGCYQCRQQYEPRTTHFLERHHAARVPFPPGGCDSPVRVQG